MGCGPAKGASNPSPNVIPAAQRSPSISNAPVTSQNVPQLSSGIPLTSPSK